MNQNESADSANRKHQKTKPPGWILEDPDVQRQVKRVAKRLSTRCGHTRSDIKDLEQDIRVYLIENEHKYDPERASVGGYAHEQLDSFIKMHIRYRLQQVRRGRLSNQPLISELDFDVRAISSLASEQVELQDLFDACIARLTTHEVRLIMQVNDVGQTRTSESCNMSRRQLGNQLYLIAETCADLNPFSE